MVPVAAHTIPNTLPKTRPSAKLVAAYITTDNPPKYAASNDPPDSRLPSSKGIPPQDSPDSWRSQSDQQDKIIHL